MNINNKLAPHETFELHELLTMKTVGATKASVMGGLVKDEALKALLQQDFKASQEHIKELQDLLKQSVLAPPDIQQSTN